MMITIEIPIQGELQKVKAFCKKYGCHATKIRGGMYYRVSTENSENFFWLGANVNNESMNELLKLQGNNLSHFATINTQPHD